MARIGKGSDEIVTDERDRPLRVMIALVVGFLVIVGIAVGTVLVPELTDDAGEDEAGRRAAQSAPPGAAPADQSPPAAPTP